jgi:hypothetical protein
MTKPLPSSAHTLCVSDDDYRTYLVPGKLYKVPAEPEPEKRIRTMSCPASFFEATWDQV